MLWHLGIMAPAATAQLVVDFQDLGLDAESSWVGPVDPGQGTEQPGTFGGTVRSGFVSSGSVKFINRFNLDFGSWDSGFAISNSSDNVTAGFLNNASAFPGAGFSGPEDPYAVAFGYVDDLDPTNIRHLESLPFFEIPAGHQVVSAQVTNSTYAALSMLQGDSFAKPFGGPLGNEPDFFRLHVFGLDAEGELLPASVQVHLADYRFEDNGLDFLLAEWQRLDLAPLSSARRLYFNLESSDRSQFGMNTPAYFAIDQIVLASDVRGDFDADGAISANDADLLCTALATANSSDTFDFNRDGAGNHDDLVAFLQAVDRQPGDADFNGSVEFADFVRLANRFQQPGTWSEGDFGCDGDVQFDDFLLLSEHFGTGPAGSAAVPEPSSRVLILEVCLLVFRRLRTSWRS